MASRSYDVYIQKVSPSESSRLVVMQFPAMQSQFDKDPDELNLSVMNTSMKMKLELCDMKLDRNGSRNTYVSTKNKIDDSQLFICKIVNDRLVCQPISQIATMRADFSHLNPKEEVDPSAEIMPVSVKFSVDDRHHTSSRVGDRLEPEEVMESYQEYSFRNLRGKHATSQRDLLFGKQTKIKPDPDAGDHDAQANIDSLVPDIKPKIERMDIDDIYSLDTKTVSNNPSKRADLIRNCVKECLLKAKLASFEEIYRHVEFHHGAVSRENPQLGKKEIIDALNEWALLVQGNWAIKSEVLYGDSGERECTDVTGININLFNAARDYLLWLFDQERLVSRLDYSRRVRIPDHDILDLFNQLSDYRPDLKKWEFRLDTDEKFMKSCPEVVDRQRTVWRVTRNNKLKIFD